ncbi:MAG: transposase [Maricaulaceae bacterium]
MVLVFHEGISTARKPYSDEDVLRLLREIEVSLADGLDVVSACRKVGVSDATSYTWRQTFDGVGRTQLAAKTALESEMGALSRTIMSTNGKP